MTEEKETIKKKDGFVFYRSFYEAIIELNTEQQSNVFRAICELALNENETDLKGVEKIVYTMAKPQILANNKRYNSGLKGAEFGKMGGRPKTPKKPLEEPQKNPKKTPKEKEKENVKDKDKDKVNVNDNNKFKPTLEEVKQYCFERKNNVDAEKWFDYYTSNGWKVGKNPMKDWKAAVRTWERSKPQGQSRKMTATETREHNEQYLINKYGVEVFNA